MYEQLAALVAEGRTRLGIDQAELGRRVGVSQQTVSRWEKGTGRPRRSVAATVAAVLSVDVDQVLDAAGYVGRTADSAREASQGVRPLVRGLPFEELAPERFEDAAAEILQRLYPDGHVSRFGGPGEKQRGIDAVVEGDQLVTAQCKRHRQFGPQDVRQAVAATEIEAAKHYLFLSRPTATAAARSEIGKYPTWELWDGEDISRYIRTQMAKDDAVRLVDTYFPNHRESFLGVPRPGPWMTTDEYFLPASRGQIFTQGWTLVGRAAELAELVDAVRSGEDGIARLLGRGGVGKTRLLRSIAEVFEVENCTVRFLPSGTTAIPNDFELLPSTGPLLLVIDDGHERSNIAEIFANLRRRNPGSRLLIASRPYGDAAMSQDLRRVGVRLADLPTITLGDLTQEDAGYLAQEALGGAHEAVVERLARLTLDCPLATVVGGVLIRQRRLDPARLEQDDQFREEILLGFREAVVAESLEGDRDSRRAVLDTLAALQPFRSADATFQTALSTAVGAPYDRLRHHLRSLEDAGILLRRGDSLRIVPDLLGDVILAQACFDENAGATTGFLPRLAEAASGDALSHIFVNASRVDWQVRQQTQTPPLADPLWDALEDELKSSELSGRLAAVRQLNSVAYFQPKRTLRLITWIVSNRTDEVGPSSEELVALYAPTWDDVLHEVAPVLRAIAYTFDSLTEACDLLWQLAQIDQRPIHQHPGHPLRLLRELAEFDVSKPVAYNDAIIDIASRWFVDGQSISPLQVLEPLLATEGSAQTYSNYTITFRPYPLNARTVRPLRWRVINLALAEVRSSDVHRAAAGVRSIETALKFPTGLYGREVPDDEIETWTPDVVETIEELGRIVGDTALDPAIAVAIMKSLHSHAEHGDGATRSAAHAVLQRLPDTTEFQLGLLLHDGWGHLVRERGVSYQQAAAMRRKHVDDVVRRALVDYDDGSLVLVLERRLLVERDAFGANAGNPNPMLAALVDARPEIGRSIVKRVIAAPDSPLASTLSVVLGRLGDSRPDELVRTARALLALGLPTVTAVVAQAFGWNRGSRMSLVEEELDLLRTFAASSDASVRESAVIAARRIASEHLQVAIDLLAGVSFADEARLADEFFETLIVDDNPMHWDLLSDEQRNAVRDQLVEISEIGGYSVESFLSRWSAAEPKEVMDLFHRRILRAEMMEHLGGYRATPFSWDVPLLVREHDDFLQILVELHSWISEGESWLRRREGAELFAAVAGNYDDAVLALFREMLARGSHSSVEGVATLLHKAHRRIIYTEVPFVLEALETAARFGDECLQSMRGALWAATIAGTRMGTPGQPFREDLEQREECARIAKSLPKGSPGELFYRAMYNSADESIRRATERDGRDDDHRSW